jgi:folate-binding protein YgfZ
MATQIMKDSFVVNLSHLGNVSISGADAETFLQGQLSNDVRLLTSERAQITSYNSPKGRMLAVLHLLRNAQGQIVAEIDRSVLDAAIKRLRMFVLRSKVTLDPIAAPALGIAGLRAVEELLSVALPAPNMAMDSAQHGELTVVRRLGEVPRFSVHGPAEALAELQKRLSLDIETGDEQDWRRLDVLAGVPTVFAETSDHFVAQMANLDTLGGISFNKGCYTGQEIVARLHYLGQLKRRMFRCHSAATNVAPATPVYVDGEAQAVGEVVQSVNAPQGSLMNVVLQLTQAESAQLRLGSVDGPALSVPES